MLDFLAKLLDTSGFPARWDCGQWTPAHGWLHVTADCAIFGAYAAIPAVIVFFALRRTDVPFLPIFWLFAGFILFCGTGHLIDATLFWHPWYRLSGLVKLATAVMSWGTVFALVRIAPAALKLPGLAKVSAELAEAEERTRSVVNHVVDGIINIDDRGTVTTFNPAAEAIFGYGASEVIGRNVSLLMPEPYRAEHDGYVRNYVATGQAKIIGVGREVVGRRKDGSCFPMDLAISEFRLGGIRYFTGIVRDITERKRSEEALRREVEQRRLVEAELRQAHEELEQRIVHRTAELAQVNARLQKSVADKEVLLREVHHRVKNNLQVISSLLELQADYTGDQSFAEILCQSQKRIRSMALVHERLYRSQDLASVDFGDYVENLADHLLQSHPAGPSVRFDLKAVGDVHLPVDLAVPCGLLLNELISNALKHAFQGKEGGTIRIKLRLTEGDRVMLNLADDGVGLPDGVDFRSTGTFGLKLVAMLVKQLGGTVQIGRAAGTAFDFVFPLTKPALLKG
jgi:PAS domain S-box-containing protein